MQVTTVGEGVAAEVVAGGVCDGVVVAEYVVRAVGEAPVGDPDD